MNNFYILKKYWSKHKKNAFAMMFSGVLTVAVIFAALMQFRGLFNRELHKLYDKDGMFDVLLPEASASLSMTAKLPLTVGCSINGTGRERSATALLLTTSNTRLSE